MNEKIRLAQIFDVSSQFSPTKSSVFLKRIGVNSLDSFVLADDIISIDATNFLNLEQNGYKFILNDSESGFTGNGYLSLVLSTDEDNNSFPIAKYPLRAIDPSLFFLFLRGKSTSSKYEVDILIDDVIVKTIDENVIDNDWFWVETSIVLPDTNRHILGIQFKRNDIILDKIVFNTDSNPSVDPQGSGPGHSISPYFTAHMQVYKVNNNFEILQPFSIYDFKNSLDEIIQTDWYNFDINYFNIDPSFGSNIIDIDYSEKAALILSSSGTNENNFIVWELVDSDEYSFLPSAIKI